MAVLKKFNLSGAEVGEVKIEDALVQTSANSQMIKDYLIALRANARQWSASTKTRPEVSHSGQKPHPQKGTGRARQGYLGAPQYKGGGRVFAPRPKFDQHVRINKKERQAAVRHLIAEKIGAQNVLVLQSEEMKGPKTKALAQFLKTRGLDSKRVLFLAESTYQAKKGSQETLSSAERHQNFAKSLRNISKAEFAFVPNISGQDVILNQAIVIMDNAVDELMMLLGGKK